MNKIDKRIGLLCILGLTVIALVAMTLRPATRGAASRSSISTAGDDTNAPSDTSRSASPMPQASYLGFDKLESLCERANAVAKGKVLAEHADRLNISEGVDREANPTFVDCIVVDFKVLRAIKGPIRKNEVISIAYLAGEDVPGLKSNASSLVFLSRTEAGPYMPLNPAQAVMRIENGQIRKDTAGQLFESGANEDDVVSQIAK